LAAKAVGLTGALLTLETTKFKHELSITLNVSQPEYELLKTLFSYCHYYPTGFLDFVDATGVQWLVAAGVDTITKRFSTGVWFDSLGDARAATEALFDPADSVLWDPHRRFTTTLRLTINESDL
jgi:hypothetical protein